MQDIQAQERIALQDVMLNYAAGVDDRDFDQYRACFTEDVSVIGMGPEPVNGLDNWMKFVRQALSKYASTQHMLGPQLAYINGENATTRTDVTALHVLDQGAAKTFTLWATYRSEMIKVQGQWKIQKHELIPRFSRQQD
ncbi:MAG: nuclear transport factor 2 family protein [Gammaproteobacteria bacterium]|jgi:ketosteroid isomerase-like protein|nr:nuclear transport factor 2 family protein [Gammaproteobacteria bacterium]MBT5203893.1 nuclear transport factor 2 family protein [Gammaproteobacteria bacterium]MBT5603671.1 nuclear transport factor 2 family protein [Gammaproteobacteria bacterium]MBT6245365.1 nuclear transport factor 2 family protein [Gammaproteobacteria bacterium]